MEVIEAVTRPLTKPFREYSEPGEDRPLGSYAILMAAFGTAVAAIAAGVARSPRLGMRASDVVLLVPASHKAARILAKDWVSSPIRAPFVTYKGPAAQGEVREEVRGRGLRQALGELLSCPYCLAPWVAAAFVAGHLFRPKESRVITTIFAAVAASDFLNRIYDSPALTGGRAKGEENPSAPC